MEGKTRFRWCLRRDACTQTLCYLCIKGAAAVKEAVPKHLACAELGHNLIRPDLLIFTDGLIIVLVPSKHSNAATSHQCYTFLIVLVILPSLNLHSSLEETTAHFHSRIKLPSRNSDGGEGRCILVLLTVTLLLQF